MTITPDQLVALKYRQYQKFMSATYGSRLSGVQITFGDWLHLTAAAPSDRHNYEPEDV